MKAPTLTTEQYQLRPFKESDAALWQVWDIDPAVQAHMPEPTNAPQTLNAHLQYQAECESEIDGYYWSIETPTGLTIGTIALTDINDHHQLAEIGIVIGDKNYWGKGVATQVIPAVVDFAFSKLGVVRISALVEKENVAMAKVLEKSGFLRDGTFSSARVKNGKRIDVLHYGLVHT